MVGAPTTLMPLTFVVAVSMPKDLCEDFKRHQSDKKENRKKVLVADKNQEAFVLKRWRDVKVGSIVKVCRDEYFPADMVLLQSSLPSGICYVETKNLDGETNAKHKQSPNMTSQLIDNEAAAIGLIGKVHC